MSLTVNALRKLQQSGDFPAPKKQDGQSSPVTTSEPSDVEQDRPDSEVRESASANTDPMAEAKTSGGSITEPILELEPPISTESDQEAHETLPTSDPWDEDDPNLSADGVPPAGTHGRTDTVPLADPKQYDDPKTVDLPLLDSTRATPARSQEPEPVQTSWENEDPTSPEDQPENRGSRVPTTDQTWVAEVESVDAAPLATEADAPAVSNERLTQVTDPVESSAQHRTPPTESLELRPAEQEPTTRDYVSDRSREGHVGGDNAFGMDTRPVKSGEYQFEPSITEGIESTEQIRQNVDVTRRSEMDTLAVEGLSEEPAEKSQQVTQPIQHDEHFDMLTQRLETLRKSTDPTDEAYNPVIQPLYELNEDISVADDTTSKTEPSMFVEAEPIQAELVVHDRPPDAQEPNHRIPAPGTDPKSQPLKFDPDAIVPLAEHEEETEAPGSETTLDDARPEETAYERELSASLSRPDVEKRFMHLCNQIYARSQYKLPASLLLVTPQQTGRVADTLAHLSVALERDGRPVIMVDANLEEQGLTRRYEAVGKPGLCDVLTENAHPADIVLPTSNASIRIVPCGDDVTGLSRQSNSVESHTIRSLLQSWTLDDSTVICDVGSMHSALALPLAESFDAVLLVVSMQDLDLDVVREATRVLREHRATLLGCITTDD